MNLNKKVSPFVFGKITLLISYAVLISGVGLLLTSSLWNSNDDSSTDSIYQLMMLCLIIFIIFGIVNIAFLFGSILRSGELHDYKRRIRVAFFSSIFIFVISVVIIVYKSLLTIH